MRLILLCIFLLILNPSFSSCLQHHSEHFVLIHSEKIHHKWLERTVSILERIYNRVGDLYQTYPDDAIPVILYDFAWQFVQATKQPVYVGAIYDGTIHMQNPKTLDKRGILISTLTHEYTHLILMKLTDGKIPLWFNEGLALYTASQTISSSYSIKIKSFHHLNQLLQDKKSKKKFMFGYKCSLKLVRKIIDDLGWDKVLDIINRSGDRETFQNMIEETYEMKWFEFEKRMILLLNK